MRTDYRVCGGSAAGFNTGFNFCPLQPGKAKAVILTYHGKKLPAELTAENLEKACHADGQDRIFPILNISEYATSGGEANTSENGYAVEVNPVGFDGAVTMMVGIDTQGNVLGISVVSHTETAGLGAVADAIYAMEKPSGAKKVCYNELDIPLIAIDELPELGKTDPMYAELAAIVQKNGGMWCAEAENYLLAHAPRL